MSRKRFTAAHLGINNRRGTGFGSAGFGSAGFGPIALGLCMSLAFIASMLVALPVNAQSALKVTVAPGYKLDTIASNLKVPRAVVQTDTNTTFVVEFGSWNKNTGSLVKLTKSGETWKTTRVLTKLDRPVGLIQGPDGFLYIGEVGRISRFDPKASNITLQRVITDLPGLGLHPLTVMAFTADKKLVVNVGSSTNNCEKFKGKTLCPTAEGPKPLGTLRLYTLDLAAGKSKGFVTLARGVRNSLGIAVHPSGTIMQAENSRDAINEADPTFDDETMPADELNVVTPGANYGWPYCFDKQRNAPEFKKYDCKKTVAPHVLLPAHSAPLGLTYWGNQLVVSYHGYRDVGHRLVGFPTDGNGKVTGQPIELISDWDESDTQEMGGPVGTSVSADGSLWITDDRNNMVLRLSRS
jgi:glucose/arabinose dehydrogenase